MSCWWRAWRGAADKQGRHAAVRRQDADGLEAARWRRGLPGEGRRHRGRDAAQCAQQLPGDGEDLRRLHPGAATCARTLGRRIPACNSAACPLPSSRTAACTATRRISIRARANGAATSTRKAQRGWFYTGEMNPPSKSLYKYGEWNHYRIEAIGPRLRVWINDGAVADVIDDASASGFIGLQVHSIDEPDGGGPHHQLEEHRHPDQEPEAACPPWASSSATTCPTTWTPKRRHRAGACCGTARPRKGWRSAKGGELPAQGLVDGQRRARRAAGGWWRRHHDRRGIRRLRAADGVQGVAPAPTAASSIY